MNRTDHGTLIANGSMIAAGVALIGVAPAWAQQVKLSHEEKPS